MIIVDVPHSLHYDFQLTILFCAVYCEIMLFHLRAIKDSKEFVIKDNDSEISWGGFIVYSLC